MRVLNFAIIGGGNIGRVHAQAIAHIPGARVAVVCDVSEKSGCAEWAASYEQAVARRDVDVVVELPLEDTAAEG